MKTLMRSVVVALLAGILCIHIAAADELAELQIQIKLAETKLDLAKKSKELVDKLKELADQEKLIAEQRKLAAEAELAAKQKRLEQPVELMRMVSGQVMVLRDPKLTCDAMPFLRWRCNGQGSCDFDISDAICGYPDAATDTVQLSVSYRCGEATVDDTFWSGQKAYLTCK